MVRVCCNYEWVYVYISLVFLVVPLTQGLKVLLGCRKLSHSRVAAGVHVSTLELWIVLGVPRVAVSVAAATAVVRVRRHITSSVIPVGVVLVSVVSLVEWSSTEITMNKIS